MGSYKRTERARETIITALVKADEIGRFERPPYHCTMERLEQLGMQINWEINGDDQVDRVFAVVMGRISDPTNEIGYVSNGERSSMIAILRELLAKLEREQN